MKCLKRFLIWLQRQRLPVSLGPSPLPDLESSSERLSSEPPSTPSKEARALGVVLETLKLFTGGSSLVRIQSSARARLEMLRPTFDKVADESGIPAALLEGVAWTESNFDRNAVNSTSGAAGLMQVMPQNFAGLGWTGEQWRDPLTNIRGGARILRESGLGRLPIRQALGNYGGFITKDPTVYVNRVLTRATFLLVERTAGAITGA